MNVVRVSIDGLVVEVPAGSTVLRACDAAGRYVPRLCYCPSLPSCSRCLATSSDMTAEPTAGRTEAGPGSSQVATPGEAATIPEEACCRPADHPTGLAVPGGTGSPGGPPACGLCVVRVGEGEGEKVLACATPVRSGLVVTTEDAELRSLRLQRLATFLDSHPHICLSCPDREGCARDECRFGVPDTARCCDEFGHCEFGLLVAYVDAEGQLPRRAVSVDRGATQEGRIRREPGICLGCGRCVAICSTSPEAGDALEMREENGRWVAYSKKNGLRASGCTFCGQCVIVCPAGAITAPGSEGRAWLEQRRKRYGQLAPVLPPRPWSLLRETDLESVPASPGVFQLADARGEVVRISGCPDLRRGLTEVWASALREDRKGQPSEDLRFRFEVAPLYTERETELLSLFAQEHGRLPRYNDLSEDLFADDLF